LGPGGTHMRQLADVLAFVVTGTLSAVVWSSVAGAEVPLCSGAGGSEPIYRAVAGKGGAELSAKVVLPTPGYTVALKERPEKVIPPMFNFVCERPGSFQREVLTEYQATATVIAARVGSTVTVYDGKGTHEVPVVDKR
jgi:hypothetical protein